MNHPVITVLDIETAPIVAHVWKLWDNNVGLNQIEQDWSILSYTAKPLDPNATNVSVRRRKAACEYKDTSTAPGGVRDDSELLIALWDIFHRSDIIVGQNVRRFDVRKIRARMMQAGMQPHSPFRILDTMEMAKSAGAFTSNKLEYLSGELAEIKKLKHARFAGHELWTECLRNNPAAWREMQAYNKVDVLATEEVYLKLRPWATQHLNVAAYQDPEHPACPVCGSHALTQDGFAFTNVSRYPRYHCGGCGAWSRSRYTVNSKAVRKNLLSV